MALKRDRKTKMLDDFPEQVKELLAYFNKSFPAGHPFGRLRVSPEMPGGPDVWMLGSSMWSSAAAVEFGLPYSFAHFFSPVHTRAAIETVHGMDSPRANMWRSHAKSVAVGVICAETQEEAELFMASLRLLSRRIRSGDRRPVPRLRTRCANAEAGADADGRRRVAALLLRNAASVCMTSLLRLRVRSIWMR